MNQLLENSFVMLLCCLPIIGLSNRSYASFYPPDYVVEKQCQSDAFVEVCATNHHVGNYPRLEIKYQGDLMRNYGGRILMNIRFNEQEETFSMEHFNNTKTVTLNAPHTYLCQANSGGRANSIVSNLSVPLCQYPNDAEGGSIIWEATPIPSKEEELFKNARDQDGQAYPWVIELSFYREDETNDNLSQPTYQFRFE